MLKFNATLRAELREHWLVLLIAFCALFFGFSAPAFALPFVFPEVIKEFGWSRQEATFIASAKYLTGAVAALVVGRFLDVTGAWVALFCAIGIGAAALFSFVFVNNLTAYYIVGFALGLAGPGAMVAVLVLVARACKEAQGTATGIALLGTSLGSVVVPLVASWAIDAYGWRWGMAFLSLGVWLVAMPLLVLGMFSKRLTVGQRPTSIVSVPGGSPMRYILELMGERTFWLLVIAFFVTAMADQAFIQHQVLILDDTGMSRGTIAAGVSAMGVIGIACRLIVGNVLDASGSRGLALLYTALTTSAICGFFIANPLVFGVYVVTRAIGHATVLLDGPVIVRQCYGTQHLGTLLGTFTALTSVAFAVGPWVMAAMFDASGSYKSAFALFIVLPLVASAAISLVRPVDWLAVRASTGAASDAGSEVAA